MENIFLEGHISEDTIKLLRECDAGIKMGISSIKQTIEYVKDCNLKKILEKSSDKHESLQDKATSLLHEYEDKGKEPNPMAKSMSFIKTNVKLTVDSSDSTVADLIIDGCHMGTKSLYKYLNQYKNANEKAKKLVEEVIKEEESLEERLREYL